MDRRVILVLILLCLIFWTAFGFGLYYLFTYII
jgi:hypothetical protein